MDTGFFIGDGDFDTEGAGDFDTKGDDDLLGVGTGALVDDEAPDLEGVVEGDLLVTARLVGVGEGDFDGVDDEVFEEEVVLFVKGVGVAFFVGVGEGFLVVACEKLDDWATALKVPFICNVDPKIAAIVTRKISERLFFAIMTPICFHSYILIRRSVLSLPMTSHAKSVLRGGEVASRE